MQANLMSTNNSGASSNQSGMSRRELLRSAAGVTVAGAIAGPTLAGQVAGAAEKKKQPAKKAGVKKGRINQSVVQWCFEKYWKLDKMCQVASGLGCKSIELVPIENWATLKKHNLECALAPSHLFVQGMNNPKYQDACIAMMKKSIDACAQAGFKTVITFTGFAEETGAWADGGIPDLSGIGKGKNRVIDPVEGAKNCVAGFKRVVGYAEKKGVNLSIEMLNSRATVEMKGHPGYQGDHTDYCMDIIKKVGSPRFGLLFDIYHVQIMDGDIINRIHECGEAINHVHTAGNPGRCEIDAKQEINYAPCMEALVDIGYKGFVGQEFIPTRNALEGLTQAVEICDV